jgi:diguanylate cyclase (GGDEF)-like protein
MSGEPAARTRVLVVDDSNLMRKAAQKMLSGEFDVVTAEDGLDAWAKLSRDTSIQVVFSDLSMPRSDGYDLLNKVRTAEDAGLQGLPLIIVTGADNDEAARMKALDMGATDFITKPFTSTDLVARARAHAKYQRITKELQEQSTLDALTGLMNKAGFTARLGQDVAFSHRHSQALTVARLEIEGLRDTFLAHGKGAAEGLVQHVAKLLKNYIREEDSAGRIGLGSFAISFPAGQHEGVEGMLGRLCLEARTAPFEFEFEVIPITLSAGVVSPVLQSDTDAASALEQAQEALDEARAAGKATPQARPQAPPPPLVKEAPAPVAPTPVVEAPKPKPMPAPAPAPVETKAPRVEARPAAQEQEFPKFPEPEIVATPATLRIDPLLDAIDAGNPRAAAEKLPQVIERLLPLLRLLAPNQRAWLVQWLGRGKPGA